MKVRTLTVGALIVFLPILPKGGFILMLFSYLLALLVKRIVEHEYD